MLAMLYIMGDVQEERRGIEQKYFESNILRKGALSKSIKAICSIGQQALSVLLVVRRF